MHIHGEIKVGIILWQSKDKDWAVAELLAAYDETRCIWDSTSATLAGPKYANQICIPTNELGSEEVNLEKASTFEGLNSSSRTSNMLDDTSEMKWTKQLITDVSKGHVSDDLHVLTCRGLLLARRVFTISSSNGWSDKVVKTKKANEGLYFRLLDGKFGKCSM
jgi:TFIIF-interacting CTD phosphatase-like protein